MILSRSYFKPNDKNFVMNPSSTRDQISESDMSSTTSGVSPTEGISEQVSQHQSTFEDANLPSEHDDGHYRAELCRWEDEGGRCIDNGSHRSKPSLENRIDNSNQPATKPDTCQRLACATNDPKSFEEFWPTYLQAHSKPETRFVHYAGPLAGVAWAVGCLATGNPLWALAAPAVVYAPLFLSHWLIEGNQPKTFEHPLWSIAAEFKLVYMGLTGQLGKELSRLNIEPSDNEWAVGRLLKRLFGK